MTNLVMDIRYGFRMLAKNPAFTAVAVLTLALGIGANAAIFSFVDGVLLKPLPYPHPERIVRVLEKPPSGGRNGISTLNFLDWKNQNKCFEYMAAAAGDRVTMTGSGEPQQINAQLGSASYFGVFGIDAVLGRTFAPDEDTVGKDQVVVLSNRSWQNRFGADPKIIGRQITLEGKSYTIIGVMPAGTVFDRTWAELWLPLVFKPNDMTRNFHWFGSFARLKPGVTLEKAQAEMDAIGARIAVDHPDSNKGWGVTIDRFADIYVGPQLRQSLWVLLAAVGSVLLIACANLANLLLARAADREREVAIRAALGAARRRLILQFLTESVMLALTGGVAGVALGYAMMRGINYLMPPFTLPPQANIHIDHRVLLFTLAVTLATGILFGLVPALSATRRDVIKYLKEGGRSSSGVGTHRLRTALIITEVTLSFLLLVGAGLLIHSFMRLTNVDLGVDTTNVITMGLPLSMEGNTDPAKLTQYLRQVIDQVQSVPGVREAAITSSLPMQGWGFGMPFMIAGHPFVDVSKRPGCFFKIVSPSYFKALGIRLKKGRSLADSDTSGAPPVTLVNEEFARRNLKGEEPIGKRVLIQQIVTGKHALGPEVAWEIVGVVANEKVGDLDQDSPGVYVTYLQSPIVGDSLLVRGIGDPTLLTKAIQSAVWQLNKNQPLTDIKTLEEIKTDSVASNRLRTTLLGIFAGVALLLAVVGIYGVISYSVAQRTHEMAIRAALGARAADLLKLVIGRAMLLAAAGLGLGLIASFGLTRLLAGLLFNTSPTEPATLIAVGAVLSLAALLACYFPARRAAKIDPMVALRYE